MSKDKKEKKSKKWYPKKALIYKHQYARVKRSSVAYQEAQFYKYGAELGLINSIVALSLTVEHFREVYGDNLDIRQAYLLLALKHYMITHGVEVVEPDALRGFIKLDHVIGWQAKSETRFVKMFSELQRMGFVKSAGRQPARYTGTTRIKVFCSQYEKTLASLFESLHQ